MADRYWVQNGAATSANTASAWNTVGDGSGSNGIPTTGDNVIIGEQPTLNAGLGNATCTWDLAITTGTFTTHSGYNGASITSTLISFTAPSTITHTNRNWADLGFRVGMQIVTTGASNAANNSTFSITAVNDNTITVTGSGPNLVDEAATPSITVVCEIKLQMHANTTMTKFTLDTTMENTTGSDKTITFSSAYPASSEERYVLNGDKAAIDNQDDLVYSYNTSANGTARMHFDDGPHPKVSVTGTSYISPEYRTPTSTSHGQTSMHSLSLGANVDFQPDASPSSTSTLNASKLFSILTTSTLAIGGGVFDAGFSTFSFTMDATNFTIPVSGDTTYGTAPFRAAFYNLIIATPSTAGHKALVPNNRTLSVNSLTVEADAVLKGHSTAGTGFTSTICSVRRPKIQGSWNFSQLSDGVYVSLMSDTFPITPSSGKINEIQLSAAGGAFTSDSKLTWASATSELIVDGKLTVTGLIDPTGMEFTAVASNPSTANPTKTIWVNNSGALMFGASAVGGGGGSGTVTNIATSAPITGGAITTTGTIGISAATTSAAGSMSGADKTKLDGIEPSADVTDATNVTAAGALMDSEVTNLAQVKAFDSADYATAAQGTTANNALPKAGGTMTGEIEATTMTLNAVPADPATDDKVRLGESGVGSNMLRIQTNDGFVDIGPNNTTWAHLNTNKSQFYMSKPLILDGGKLYAYNDGLQLGTGTTASAGTTAITIADGSTNVEIIGTIKQGASTNAVLVSDANGNIVSASTLADIAYLAAGAAGQDPFNPANPANWAITPPFNIEEAIQRIAAELVALSGGPIP